MCSTMGSRDVRLASLYSGGKDSTFATLIMEEGGHTVDHLVSIMPMKEDSWVFHTPNLHLMPKAALSMGKRLVTVSSDGTEQGDLDALASALIGLEVEGVIIGALASDYQWDRINGVCEKMGLKVMSPLWRKSQTMVMREMVDSGVKAIVVGTFAEGLDASWLGRVIDHMSLDELEELSRHHGINISGEGGEYETFTVDSPLHSFPLRPIRCRRMESRDSSRLIIEELGQ